MDIPKSSSINKNSDLSGKRVVENEYSNQKHPKHNLLDRTDKHYETVREIVAILSSKKMLINEAYVILDQVKDVLGYTQI